MGKKMNVTVKGRPGEEAKIPIDPERSGSLLLRKCMRALESGDDVVGFRGLNGKEADLEAAMETIVAQCGDVLIAIYPDDGAATSPLQEEAAPQALTTWDAPAPDEPQEEEPPPEPEPAPAAEAAPAPSGGPTPAPNAPKKNMATLKGHDKQVASVSFSPTDATMLASAGYDNHVVLWDVGAHRRGGGEVRRVLAGHTDAVTCVAFHPTRPGVLASGSGDATVRIWDALSGRATAVLEGGHSDWVKGVAWSPFSPAALASVSDDGSLLLWDADQGTVKKKFEGGHSDFVTAVAFSPADLTVLASASVDRSVVVWNIKSGGVLYKFTEAKDEVHTLAWSSFTEGLLATGSHDAKVRVYDATTEDGGGELFKTLMGHTSEVNCVAFSADGVLASASDDATIIVWNLEAECPLHVLSSGHEGLAACVAWSLAEPHMLASGGEDAGVVVWAPASLALWNAPAAKAAAPAPSRGGRSGSSGGSGGGSGGSGGGGDGGAAVLAELATMKADVAEFRSEVKRDLKDLQKAVVVMNATVEHVLALVKLGAN